MKHLAAACIFLSLLLVGCAAPASAEPPFESTTSFKLILYG